MAPDFYPNFGARSEPHRHAHLRFLVVDDHTPTRTILCEMVMAHPDWRVIAEAGDGESAVALAVAQRPDVILMDIAMPGLNGLHATRQIRAKVPNIKVILFSAYGNGGFQQGSREVGADFFIKKEELTTQVLSEILAKIMNEPGGVP